MGKPIDLRSDTVTHPTPEMREAMYRAELGDDVYGEDPTVNRLEDLAAEMLGKEASVFVASGTQGNAVALLTHCGRGDEAIMGNQAHTYLSEVGGSAAMGGIHPRPIPTLRGMLPLDEVEAAIRPQNVHYPTTRLICVENTHNGSGGCVLNQEQMASIKALADRHGIRVHLDGARVFNAATYLKCDVRELTQYADSVQFCLSKGLSAPVGSMLCGTKQFVLEARRMRKMLGGGTRQAGVLAAAGIIALEKMVDRLQEDHDNARVLAEGMAQIDGVELDLTTVQTNIIRFSVRPDRMTAAELSAALGREGIKANATGKQSLRMVTHYGISREDVLETVAAMQRILSGQVVAAVVPVAAAPRSAY